MTPRPRIILAIDDMPERYLAFCQALSRHNLTLVCVQHPVAVEMILQTADVPVILLDHDMPTYEWDDQTNAIHINDKYNGQYFARWIVDNDYRAKVIISSANSTGAKKISEILGKHPHRIMSVLESCPEERWLGAILDCVYRSDIHAEKKD